MPKYDRELIARMLETPAVFEEASRREQARLLRETDNKESTARTISLGATSAEQREDGAVREAWDDFVGCHLGDDEGEESLRTFELCRMAFDAGARASASPSIEVIAYVAVDDAGNCYHYPRFKRVEAESYLRTTKATRVAELYFAPAAWIALEIAEERARAMLAAASGEGVVK